MLAKFKKKSEVLEESTKNLFAYGVLSILTGITLYLLSIFLIFENIEDIPWSAWLYISAIPIAYKLWVIRHTKNKIDVEQTEQTLRDTQFARLIQEAGNGDINKTSNRIAAIMQLPNFVLSRDNLDQYELEACIAIICAVLKEIGVGGFMNSDKITNIDSKEEDLPQYLTVLYHSAQSSLKKLSKYLEGADLQGAYLVGITLKDANLKNANLSKANLKGCHIVNTSLENSSLKGADLEDGYFENVTIKGSFFRQSNLQRAFFNKTNISGVNFTKADLKDAYLAEIYWEEPKDFDFHAIYHARPRFENAEYSQHTVWPRGYELFDEMFANQSANMKFVDQSDIKPRYSHPDDFFKGV